MTKFFYSVHTFFGSNYAIMLKSKIDVRYQIGIQIIQKVYLVQNDVIESY